MGKSPRTGKKGRYSVSLEKLGISEQEAEHFIRVASMTEEELKAYAEADRKASETRARIRFYGAGAIKMRNRRTKAEINFLLDQIYDVLREDNPQTVRGVFYQMASVRLLVPKIEEGYKTVQRLLLKLRRSGVVPYEWITDSTRWVRRVDTHSSVEDFLIETASLYRKDLWSNQNVHIEIWCEKDALAGVLMEETVKWRVDLYAGRGFSSDTYLHTAAESIKAKRKPAFIYMFGDYDPSGLKIDAFIERRLKELAPGAEIHFERIGVTPKQIKDWKLPTRPTKRQGNSHAKGFESKVSVELDAIPARTLRELVSECIQRHVNRDALSVVLLAEEEEQRILKMFTNDFIDAMQ